MLTKPKCGWTNIVIGNNVLPASYLTDVPINCLDSMILSYRNHNDFCVNFDAEGWTFKIIADEYITYIIKEKNRSELIVCENINLDNLAKELIYDIEANINDWMYWVYRMEEEEEVLKYKELLLKKVDILKKIVNAR